MMVIVYILLAIVLIILPIVTFVFNKMFFGKRYETAPWLRYSVEEFDGLTMERSDFNSQGTRIAGYKYANENQAPKAVVILAHSFGGGGHVNYMPFIDYFTSRGYAVFSYDIRGHDESDGNAIRGLPQGIVDLDSALRHVKEIEEYKELPLALFGHSWGGFSVANVLNLHPDVKAAAIVAGFCESGDLLRHQGEQLIGFGIHVLMPYMKLYERIVFGREFTQLTALEGMAKTDAGIIIFHSEDDDVVPPRYGYERFHEAFGDHERFRFVLYEDEGHANLLFTDEAVEYLEQVRSGCKGYLEEKGLELNQENVNRYWEETLDRVKAFEPKPELMDMVIETFDRYCLNGHLDLDK